MNRKIILLLILISFFVGCSSKKTEQITEEKSVTIEKVKREIVKNTLVFTGTANPWEEAALAAQMASRIKKIFVKEGDYVRAGQLLVQMDDAQLSQVEMQYNDAKRDFERAKTLKEEGAISDQQYEKLKTAYETLKTNYERVLENTQLRAPFSGVITAKYFNDGELFLMTPSGARAVPAILYLMDISNLKVKISVNESDSYKLKIGQKAEITNDNLPNEKFYGVITRISPVVDPNTKTVSVEIKVPNSGWKIRAGSFVRVEINLGERNELVIPTSSILTDPISGRNFVYVYDKGIAKRVFIVVGKQVNEFTVVKSGLKENDSVIIEGQQNLVDGEKVKIFQELK